MKSHNAVTLLTKKKVYIVDLSTDLQSKSKGMVFPVPYIFTAKKYMDFMKLKYPNNQPACFLLTDEDVTKCKKKFYECDPLFLGRVCEAYDSSTESVMGKYKVPAMAEDAMSIVFSYLTGRDTVSGIKNDLLETISYEDLVKTPLLSKILPPETKDKILKGTANFYDYRGVGEALSKEGKALSDEDADKFIVIHLSKIIPYEEDPKEPGFHELASSYYTGSEHLSKLFAYLTGADIDTRTRNIGLSIISKEDFQEKYITDEFMKLVKDHTITRKKILCLCNEFYKSGHRLSGKDADNIICRYFLVC